MLVTSSYFIYLFENEMIMMMMKRINTRAEIIFILHVWHASCFDLCLIVSCNKDFQQVGK